MTDFICINSNLLEDKRLASVELIFLIKLINIADKEGVFAITLTDLMDRFSMKNRAQLVKYINNLVEYGYLERLEVPKNAPTVYKIAREIFYK